MPFRPNPPRRAAACLAPLLAALLPSAAPAHADLPDRPESIEFAPLKFEPPAAAEFRHELSNGVPVFLAPSREFPLVNIAVSFKGGASVEPPDTTPLAAATAAMMRRGGTTSVAPSALDDRLDFLAAQAGVSASGWSCGATLNCLVSNLDEALALFVDMLRNPGFDAEKLAIWKGELIESLRQRNDDAGPILDREWNALLYGRDHFAAREPTQASVERITPERMRQYHGRVFHPGNMKIAVTGDFEVSDMLARLEKAFGGESGWAKGDPVPDPLAPSAVFAPGVYHVEKAIPQGKVYIGLRAIPRDHPDFFALTVMDDILGAGGFTSRITKRVRSDEGLAYSAGSRLRPEVWYPGEWRAGFQSKNATVALATKIVLEEVERIRTDLVSAEELETTKSQFIETFPRNFESRAGMLALFVNDEWTKRPADFWKSYRDRVQAVTAEDVRRVAREWLVPENMAIFVVGDWKQIAPGDLEGRAAMAEFFGGKVEHLPLRDPLTLEPLR